MVGERREGKRKKQQMQEWEWRWGNNNFVQTAYKVTQPSNEDEKSN